METYKDVYNDLVRETNEQKSLIEELELNKKSLLNNKLYENYDYQKIVADYLSMKKPNKLLLASIIDRITMDKDKNIEIFYKIKPVFDIDDMKNKLLS